MARKQRLLDVSAGPVQAFAAELRDVRAKAGDPTFDAMARTAHRSKSSLSEAAGGTRFPSWETVEAFLAACNVDQAKIAIWRVSWLRANQQLNDAAVETGVNPSQAETPQDRPVASEEPPVVALPVAPSSPGRAGGRKTRIAFATAAVMSLMAISIFMLAQARSPSAFRTLSFRVPSPTSSWPTSSNYECHPSKHWSYQFPSSYQGQAYVQLLAVDGTADRTVVRLVWGKWQWQRSVEVEPGSARSKAGGTVLVFTKHDLGPEPGIQVDANVSLCAAFGTAAEPVTAAPLRIIDANRDWSDQESLPNS